MDRDESTARARALPVWAFACVFVGIGAFFLWTEHRAHLMGALPYALLLLCPILHLFMHRGHGGHGTPGNRHDGHAEGRSDER